MGTTRVVDSVAEVHPAAWDALLDETATMRHGWIKTMEESLRVDADYRHVLAYDGERLVGAAPCCIEWPSNSVYTMNDTLLGRPGRWTSKLGISFLPAFVCSTMKSDGPNLLVDPGAGAATRRAIANELLAAIELEANREGLSVMFSSVSDPDMAAFLRSRGYAETVTSPDCYLDIEWPSFDGYLEYIRRTIDGKMKRQITSEIRRNRAAGVHIRRLEELNGCEEHLYRLMDDHYHRHNSIPYSFTEGFFAILLRNLPEDAIINVAEKEGSITSVVFLIRGKRGIMTHGIGVDHELAGNDYTYFMMAYYRPIEEAIAGGVKHICYGNAAYEAKIRRGCKVKPVSIFHKSRSRLLRWAVRPYFTFHRFWWKKRKCPRLPVELSGNGATQ